MLAVAGVGAVAVGTTFCAGFIWRHELFRQSLELPPFTHAAADTLHFQVAMRDGIRLQTQVYLPSGDGPHPTVLIRNPYNFGNVFGFLCGVFVRYGYACVHQDVRGRMGSEGEWAPVVNERRDGLDTLAWLTQQPFQDGNIAMYGMSYLAAVQWSVADAMPPQVKTLIPMVFGTDAYGTHYSAGMYRLEIFTAWASMMPGDDMRFDHGEEYAAAVRHRPHVEVDEKFFGRRLPWYRAWISSPNRTDDVWQDPELLAFQAAPERTEVPVLMLGGWYDIFLPAQLDDFRRLRSRSRSRLVIGPWHHLQRADSPPPGDFGLGGQWRHVFAWLDHHLRGAPLDGPVGVVQTYVYGEGCWRTRADFPPTPDRQRTFFFSDLAKSPQCAGGRLTETSSRAESVSYRYDPADPVPANGGSSMLAFAFRTYQAVQPGPRNVDGVCARPDVLTFQSEPLQADLAMIGSPVVRLRASSDAPDTAFTAKLIEVGPDGNAIHVRDGIRSLAYRGEHREGPPANYQPGDVVDVEIALWPIEWTFSAGSRIRIDVSSSNFPVYHAHPNRAGLWSAQTGADVSVNTVHGGSRLILFEQTKAAPADTSIPSADAGMRAASPGPRSADTSTVLPPRDRACP